MRPILLLAMVWSLAWLEGVAAATSGNPEEVDFFVSSRGKDTWSGKLADPGENDGPFATLARARDAVRALRRVAGAGVEHMVVAAPVAHEPAFVVAGRSHEAAAQVDRGDRERDQEVLERAAALAAWHSKARNAKSVDVHYCRASAVKKPRGAPAGLVVLDRYESVRVRPAPFVEDPE